MPTMKTSQSVHFPVEVVTSISRTPNAHEMYRLVAFDRHVRQCHTCVTASRSPEFSETICNRGRYFAFSLLECVLGASNGHTYSTLSYHTRFIRVEIPQDLHYARQLYARTSYKRPATRILKHRQPLSDKVRSIRSTFRVVRRTRNHI